ncbi:MAG: PAS-domain containing protein, partial [Vicinamibacteria bacterium]
MPQRRDSAKSGAAERELVATLTRAGLDTFDFGFAIFDEDLRLVDCNQAFRTLRGYPAALCRPGTELVEFYRYNARRGDYGEGDVELQAQTRLVRVRARHAHELEHTTSTGQVLLVRYAPIAQGGVVLTYADITARKSAEALAERTQRELKVALDNMPGAL